MRCGILLALLLNTMALGVTGTWTVFDTSNSPLPYNQVGGVVAGVDGEVYATARSGRLYQYTDGSWDSIAVDTSGLVLSCPVVDLTGSLWMTGYWHGLRRAEPSGTVSVFDSTNSCLPAGASVNPLGIDRNGRLLAFTYFWYGLGGDATGLLRFGTDHCDSVDIGPLKGTSYQMRSYCRDSSGVEWFSVVCAMDVPTCGDMGGIYALQDGVLHRHVPVEYWASPAPLVSDSAATYFSMGSSLGVIQPDTVRTIDSVQGQRPRSITALFVDSRGALWVGTEGYVYDQRFVGIVHISGQDTTVMNHLNSGFAGYFPQAFAEDGKGRIWVATYLHGLWVFTYGDSAGVRGTKGATRAMGVASSSAASHTSFDIRGRAVGVCTPAAGVTVVQEKQGAMRVRPHLLKSPQDYLTERQK
jgi:ligand-binding sensor domain-containing protein